MFNKRIIHKKRGRWYFWNETWRVRIGPYFSEREAREALVKYAKKLRIQKRRQDAQIRGHDSS